MKHTITILLVVSTFYGFSQVESLTETRHKGPIKSVFSYTYSDNKKDTVPNKKGLHPTCEVCDHYQKFNESGQIIESQEYIIAEPVSDLEMGYCLKMVFMYDKDELVSITSKISEEHGMAIWSDEFANGTEGTVYSKKVDGDITSTMYKDQWGSTYNNQYQNGLLTQDSYRVYYYDEKNRKIKTTSIEEDSYTTKTEKWIYKNDLLEKFTSINDGDYYSGYETRYVYYESGKLLSETKYKLQMPEANAEPELNSTKYYYKDGRDSLHHFVNLYSDKKTKRDFTFHYEFHDNGAVSTKTEKTALGEICAFDSYDDRGNLTQHNDYNIHFKAYNIDQYLYNEKDQMIEKHVTNNYDKEEFTILYKYDEHGNETHQYIKNRRSFVLIQHCVFEYF